ncbi:MAG: DUF2283 domain-containing protein [Deltaproteobacteria bacterium]|nr:DUF2283 domain-containing protein [Deltaproteobacteria bacterium]MBW1911379.1 DUF2283 domain-containing protein [Deltaproteobacteria bacterium]MBW2034737.1 DUF2283 domain-containing protein [Deltaproteobacteria bacterium]MBW2115848.1 DUF2283 domain-containing protein [Deltaproteobacteria bacterium]MBW2359109.1 DUF2283 domain-containing protein [Deltaproteobacteria bacterium]
MKIRYDPSVDALDIRLLEGKIECEVIHLSDQVSIDIGPDGKVVAIEVLDATELIPDLMVKGIETENLLLTKGTLANP